MSEFNATLEMAVSSSMPSGGAVMSISTSNVSQVVKIDASCVEDTLQWMAWLAPKHGRKHVLGDMQNIAKSFHMIYVALVQMSQVHQDH